MYNPEILATFCTQDTGQRKTKQINVRENRRGNQECTIQRHWQHFAHKIQDKEKQNTKTQKLKKLKKRATRTHQKTGVIWYFDPHGILTAGSIFKIPYDTEGGHIEY